MVYGQPKQDDEEGPIYRSERKKKKVDYKSLLPQSDNEIDNIRKTNEDKDDKSYGYVKDHHGNAYFKVCAVISVYLATICYCNLYQ